MKATSVIVLDAGGRQLSPTTHEKSGKLLAEGKAALVSEKPLTIQFSYSVELPPRPREVERAKVGEGKRILLHICCGPCGTYPIERLRGEGFQVTGFWYNPNIHPWQEHQRRRESVRKYADAASSHVRSGVGLPVIWHEKYEMPLYLRAVVGHEKFRERCRICYRMRLEKTARVARHAALLARPRSRPRTGHGLPPSSCPCQPYADCCILQMLNLSANQRRKSCNYWAQVPPMWSAPISPVANSTVVWYARRWAIPRSLRCTAQLLLGRTLSTTWCVPSKRYALKYSTTQYVAGSHEHLPWLPD